MALLILVAMGDEDAMLSLAEKECEGVERPGRTQPDEFVGPQIHRGLEMILDKARAPGC